MMQRPPDLSFRFQTMPPRKTHQGGVRYCRDDAAEGGVRVYTEAAHRAEAWEMLGEFARRLPSGWRAPTLPARVRIELVYPLRKADRRREELRPHVCRPDADNLVKSILDAMTRAGVWADDAAVWDLRVRKWRGEPPRWAVFVWFEGDEREVK